MSIVNEFYVIYVPLTDGDVLPIGTYDTREEAEQYLSTLEASDHNPPYIVKLGA